ncbi:MAG: ribonuclease HII [Bacteroidota bacterium]|nr:ribonuclease HII [Bacteroidota bacterium]
MTKQLLDIVVKGRVEAGCDEAGRGCLAGPVVAAAVVLDPRVARNLPLNDSKKLTAKQRESLRLNIESEAISWAVAFVSPEEIDHMNILQASFEAMRRAVRALAGQPDHLLIDGNRFVSAPDMPPHTCFVKGDAKVASIAAASILAKTHRDEYMTKAADAYPNYGWQTNMGYPTVAHRKALVSLGPTPLHRSTFSWASPSPTLFD